MMGCILAAALRKIKRRKLLPTGSRLPGRGAVARTYISAVPACSFQFGKRLVRIVRGAGRAGLTLPVPAERAAEANDGEYLYG
jgi:hypothetical protein